MDRQIAPIVRLGTFSLHYLHPYDDMYPSLSLDWDWMEPRRWMRSRRATSTRWEYLPGLDLASHAKLLVLFGLEKWADEYPMHQVYDKAPAWLIAERRKKEAEFRLIKLEVQNENAGPLSRFPAELFE